MLTRADHDWLKSTEDLEYRNTYAENARRHWQPIWCVESGVEVETVDATGLTDDLEVVTTGFGSAGADRVWAHDARRP